MSIEIAGTPPPISVPDGYYANDRPELAALVPISARRILEFGCGAGGLGAALKQRQACHVTGFEYVPAVAAIAGTRLDRVLTGDCEALDFASLFSPGEFDCIVAGDVLEHLRDPEWMLRRLEPFLAANAAIVTSIPNVRHISVLAPAVEGTWTYQDAGILDRTHLRFFTRREIDNMFGRLGYTLEERVAISDGMLQQWEQAGRPGTLQAGALTVTLPPDEMYELFVYQWISRARARSADVAVAAYQRGVQLMQSGEAGRAVAEFEGAVQCTPHMADFHNALAAAHFEAGHLELAIEALTRAAVLAPDNEDVQANLAEARALAQPTRSG